MRAAADAAAPRLTRSVRRRDKSLGGARHEQLGALARRRSVRGLCVSGGGRAAQTALNGASLLLDLTGSTLALGRQTVRVIVSEVRARAPPHRQADGVCVCVCVCLCVS